MKFCLSSRQEAEYLKQADEIKFLFRDRKAIPDFIEKYPSAKIILMYSNIMDEGLSWTEIKNYSILARGNFYLCADSVQVCLEAAEHEIQYFHSAPAKTAYEINALINLGVSYIIIDAPVFFDANFLQTVDTPLRITPNVANKDGLPRDNGVSGSWIRPEDINVYEDIFDIVDFDDYSVDRVSYYRKERALFRLYSEEERKWYGDLNTIITGLDYEGVVNNVLISPNLAKHRLYCKQNCEQGGSCRLCYRTLYMSNRQKIKNYQDKISKN